MKKLRPYKAEIESDMKKLYESLSEKDRRRYAAIEAKKLGYGGISYVCKVMACSNESVKRGLRELEQSKLEDTQRLRHAGAGRKRVVDTMAGLLTAFTEVMTPHSAGSPMDEAVKWSNLSRPQISKKLKERGFDVSVTVVDQLLKEQGFRRRKAFKSVAGKQAVGRDEQFKNIERLVNESNKQGNPVMSMDVKKKN
jgi:hypothetical protein